MLNLGSRGTCFHPFRVLQKVVIIMSTYEEFMIILTIRLLIVAILNPKNKKQPSCSWQVLTQNWVRTMIFSLYLFVRSFNPGISDWTGTLVCVMLNAA